MLDYFYSPPENRKKDLITISGEEFNHLVHVMRKKIGDYIMIVDGNGNAYQTILINISKKQAEAKIIEEYKHHNEPEKKLTLAVALLKNPSKYDFLVEKTVELGVNKLIPLLTQRTIPRSAKVERWQKLSIAAMKQSGRSFLPKILDPVTLLDLISEKDDYTSKIIFHNTQGNFLNVNDFNSIHNLNLSNILILIGPEGGFTDEEVELSVNAGFQIVSLGTRRLRTETAAIVAGTLMLT